MWGIWHKVSKYKLYFPLALQAIEWIGYLLPVQGLQWWHSDITTESVPASMALATPADTSCISAFSRPYREFDGSFAAVASWFYLNSNSLKPISTEKRFTLEGWKKGRGRFSEWKSSCCARSHSSAALFFSFGEAEPRKIISKQRGVATHLALINVGPYGAEPAKQRGRRTPFSRT